MRLLTTFTLATGLALSLPLAGQTTYFSEDFSGLTAWTKGSAAIVKDASSTYGDVLTFTLTSSGGDIATSSFKVPDVSNLRISFDYKGEGGFLGFGLGSNNWLAGSASYATKTAPALMSTYQVLDYKGGWNHYDLALPTTLVGNAIMLEDFVSPASNAYFDNIRVYAIPEPSTYAALLGVGSVTFVVWKRRRKS